MENLQGGTLALEHHYHLDQRLDSFGLVTLYAGTQDPFDLPVRIAVYGGLLEAGAEPGVAARIKEAAQRSSRLRHPGLLPTVDFGEIEEGVPFVIEKTVPGPSLADRIDSQSVFSPADVAELIGRIAQLLQGAHDDHVFHGCLKPEWIFFPSDDAPMATAHLAHVGISPSMEELVSMGQAVLTTDLVDAFAPESFDVAARDQREESGDDDSARLQLSAAADQWALAALAYRMLVGVHPYFDDPVDASEGILRIKTEGPPSLDDMGVDEEISRAVDRALQRDPERRYGSIDEFARQFERAVTGDSATESSSTDRQQPADSADATDAVDSDGIDADHRQPSPFNSEPAGPRPSGYLLTGALAALLLTNLGWFFTVLHGDSPPDEDEEPSVAEAAPPDILPAELTGTQIDTNPSASQIVELGADGSEEILDTTPFTVSELLDHRSQIELLLRHPGYVDQRLTIDASDTRQDLQLDLVDRPDDP